MSYIFNVFYETVVYSGLCIYIT